MRQHRLLAATCSDLNFPQLYRAVELAPSGAADL
jgi:hypothetical protein